MINIGGTGERGWKSPAGCRFSHLARYQPPGGRFAGLLVDRRAAEQRRVGGGFASAKPEGVSPPRNECPNHSTRLKPVPTPLRAGTPPPPIPEPERGWPGGGYGSGSRASGS